MAITTAAEAPGVPDGDADAEGVTPWCDRLAAVAAAWAARPERWAGAVQHRPGERWYGLLASTPALSVWLITWPPGTGLALHDHGGSAGALAVVGGELTEWHGDARTFAAARPALTRRRLPRGSVIGFSAVHVHEVRNLAAVPATSIHAYAPRLDGMAFYDRPEADRAGRPAVRSAGVAP